MKQMTEYRAATDEEDDELGKKMASAALDVLFQESCEDGNPNKICRVILRAMKNASEVGFAHVQDHPKINFNVEAHDAVAAAADMWFNDYGSVDAHGSTIGGGRLLGFAHAMLLVYLSSTLLCSADDDPFVFLSSRENVNLAASLAEERERERQELTGGKE